MRLSERLYQAILRVYPREFREEYAEEMAFLFAARASEGRLRLWAQILRDILVHAPAEHWSMMRQDVRYALRSWRRTPAVPAIALIALTLGMGANIAIFSVTHAVLLRPLPIRSPRDVVVVRETRAAQGLETSAASMPNYLSWSERARTLDLAAYSGAALTWTGPGRPERLGAVAATVSFLNVIGGSLHTGRWFAPGEGQPEPRVVVLSHRLWRTRFAADEGVLGRQLTLNGNPHTVIGVASPDLTIPSDPDVWVPQYIDPAARRENRYLSVIGRLKPDASLASAQAEMAAIARALEAEFPGANKDFGIGLAPFVQSLVPREIRTALLVLLGATGMVLLMACMNVAHVLLSRASARRAEIAIRTALGAGAARITRQLLTESVLLAGTGTLLGLGLAAAIVSTARRGLADVVPHIDRVGTNAIVLAFAIGLTVVTGVAFGLAPLWHFSRVRRHGLFSAAGRIERTTSSRSARTVLVVAQVSVTTLLLIGAALLVQSLTRLQRVPLGFNADSVTTAKLSLTRARLPNGTAIAGFLSRLTSDLESTPGVRAAGVSTAIPLSPGAFTVTRVGGDGAALVYCQWRLVDAGYFRAFQIPLLRGRLFVGDDNAKAPRVFVISQQAARALYGEADPIGRRLRLENGQSGEIVGLVADVRMTNLADPPERVVYFPPDQFGFFPLFNVVVRSDGSAEAAPAAIRERLQAIDPNLAAYEVQTMQHWVDRNAALMRIRAQLIAALGAIALVMGIVGIYGVLSYLVSLRAHEFAVRVALGARPAALPMSVMAQALRLTVPGIALGLVAARFFADRAQALLFEIDPRDPVTYAGVAAAVVLIALTAACVPARRAAAADPLEMLRAE